MKDKTKIDLLTRGVEEIIPQNEFKKKHPSYDFTNQKVLLKEYFSYEYQNSLEKL